MSDSRPPDVTHGIRSAGPGWGAVGFCEELGAAEVAAELGLADVKELLAAIRADPSLQHLGLAPLLNGATIQRNDWDSLDGQVLSTIRQTAHELRLGTPYRVV